MQTSPHIQLAITDDDVASTFKVLSQLRPDLEAARFVETISELQASEGFCLAALREDGLVRAVAGFRGSPCFIGVGSSSSTISSPMPRAALADLAP